MRTRGELVAGLAIAIATLVMGVIGTASTGAAVPKSTCTLVSTQARTPSPTSSTDQAAPASAAPSTQASTGDLSVTIPPVVFVRAQGRLLSVTTNTGRPPQPTDQFFTLVGKRALPTTAQVRALVLADCPAHRQR